MPFLSVVAHDRRQVDPVLGRSHRPAGPEATGQGVGPAREGTGIRLAGGAPECEGAACAGAATAAGRPALAGRLDSEAR